MTKLAQFIQFSSVITHFNELAIKGTGQSEVYFSLLEKMIGTRNFNALLDCFSTLAKQTSKLDKLETSISQIMLTDPLYGPLTLNLVQLWYAGSWQQLPDDWRNRYGQSSLDTDHVVSPEAYTEGLVWPAMETHPQGAKQPGFGTWQFPPINTAQN